MAGEVETDGLAAEPLAVELGPAEFDWERTLSKLAEIRGRVRSDVDAVALVREGREELEGRRRGRCRE